jgi:hypothetical protein
MQPTARYLPPSMPMASLPFATEDGPEFRGHPTSVPPRQPPPPQPPQMQPVTPVSIGTVGPAPMQHVPPPMAPPPMAMVPQNPPPPRPAAPPPPTTPPISIPDEQVLMLSQMLEEEMKKGLSAKDLVKTLVDQEGAQNVSIVAHNLSVERLVSVVQHAPGGDRSPLVRRHGQEYLRAVLEEARKL